MERITPSLCVGVAAVVLMLSATADAANASRGRTLYDRTYACSDCHDANPTRFTAPAPTVNALLSAI